MPTKRGDIADKWHMYCADCGAKNHTNASECSVCGYGSDGQAFGVRNKKNIGKPEYTSDGPPFHETVGYVSVREPTRGEAGRYQREDNGG